MGWETGTEDLPEEGRETGSWTDGGKRADLRLIGQGDWEIGGQRRLGFGEGNDKTEMQRMGDQDHTRILELGNSGAGGVGTTDTVRIRMQMEKCE